MEKPKFEIGQKAYIIGGNQLIEVIIEKIVITITNKDTKIDYFVEKLGHQSDLYDTPEDAFTHLKSNIKDYKWVQNLDTY